MIIVQSKEVICMGDPIDTERFVQKLTKTLLNKLNPYYHYKKNLVIHNGQLTIGKSNYKLEEFKSIYIIGIGKAAAYDVKAVSEIFNENQIQTENILLTKRDHCLDFDARQFEADHPVPSEEGLKASSDFLRAINQMTDRDLALFLISGGTSSLLEKLPDDLSLNDLIQMNERLLASGASINEMNKERRKNSLVKAGGLLNFFEPKDYHCLYTSDVPGDRIIDIGSGPLYFENDEKHLISLSFDKYYSQVKTDIFEQDDLLAPIVYDCSSSEIVEAEFEKINSLTNYISFTGGEGTVKLPENNHGKGGRNTHWVLEMAIKCYENGHESALIYSLASDGTDGPFDFAGAWITYDLYQKGKNNGLDPHKFLNDYNSAEYFKNLNTLIKTGPTGSNIMDLRLLINRSQIADIKFDLP